MSQKNKNGENMISRPLRLAKIALIVLVNLFFLFTILLVFIIDWGCINFNGAMMEEILFTVLAPLKGTDPQYFRSLIFTGICPAIFIYLLVLVIQIVAYLQPEKTPKAVRKYGYKIGVPLCFVAIVGCYFSADKAFDLNNYLQRIGQSSTFIEEAYVDAAKVEITFPEEKQNLIWIYVESLETTLMDTASGGSMSQNLISEMTEIAKDNISFSQTTDLVGAHSVNSTTWTIAGLVAQNSGMPMKINFNTELVAEVNSYLPEVTAIGDILSDNGYSNYFMCGSDADYANRRLFFTAHGDYTIYDYYTAIEDGIIEEDYYVWWGMEDMYLFEYAKEKLLEIAQNDEPFNFSILTVDSHREDGYVCSLCGDEYVDQYSNVWVCTSQQVSSFVEWIMEQDFYENTTIVITGDHPSMDVDYYEGLDDSRFVYNAYINSLAEADEEATQNRQFSTLDFFPTTLAALGATIEGNRLGLGVNLFSKEETIIEIYGLDYVNEELAKYSAFYMNLMY